MLFRSTYQTYHTAAFPRHPCLHCDIEHFYESHAEPYRTVLAYILKSFTLQSTWIFLQSDDIYIYAADAYGPEWIFQAVHCYVFLLRSILYRSSFLHKSPKRAGRQRYGAEEY